MYLYLLVLRACSYLYAQELFLQCLGNQMGNQRSNLGRLCEIQEPISLYDFSGSVHELLTESLHYICWSIGYLSHLKCLFYRTFTWKKSYIQLKWVCFDIILHNVKSEDIGFLMQDYVSFILLLSFYCKTIIMQRAGSCGITFSNFTANFTCAHYLLTWK